MLVKERAANRQVQCADPVWLKSVSAFSSLSVYELEELSSSLQERHFPKKSYILREGNHADTLWIVRSGLVKVLRNTACGNEIILEILFPGDILGAVAVFNRGDYPASVQAQSDAVLLGLSSERLFYIMERYPHLSNDIMKALGERLKQAHDMMRSLTEDKVESRIAGVLLKLNERTGPVLAVTRQDLAEMAGTTVETAIRVTSRFRKRNLIRSSRGSIIIVSAGGLRAFNGSD